LAQKYFASCIEITDPYYETKNAIKNGYNFTYEAAEKFLAVMKEAYY
jgi:hypothetical protein